MPKMSRQKMQNQLLDSVTRNERYLCHVGKSRYDQTYRNRHIIPKKIDGNRRLAEIKGDWGLVVSAKGASTAFKLGLALDAQEQMPEDVGKCLCLGPNEFVDDFADYAEAVVESGLCVVFDDTGIFDGIAVPAVPKELVSYRENENRGRLIELEWHGEVPESYIEYAHAQARKDAFGEMDRPLTKKIGDIGLNCWMSSQTARTLSRLSYDFAPAANLDFYELGHGSGYKSFPFIYDYDESAVKEAEKARVAKELEPFEAVADIWRGVLKAHGLKLDGASHSWHELEIDDTIIERFLETGKLFGVDKLMQAHFEFGIPVADLATF